MVPYEERHVPRYHEWMKSSELQYLTASDPLTLQEEFLMQKRWHEDENKCTFIVLDKSSFESTNDETDAMIGDTNLFFNDPDEPGRAEIEIMIAEPAYRGKGKGWEATVLMLLYGIDTLGVRSYVAKIKLDNAKSIEMFEKLGFQEVERSKVFAELTLEKLVDRQWKEWLRAQASRTSN